MSSPLSLFMTSLVQGGDVITIVFVYDISGPEGDVIIIVFVYDMSGAGGRCHHHCLCL